MQCHKLGLHFCPVRARQRAHATMVGVRQSPDYQAKIAAGVAAAASMRALRREALAWCPLEYRADYRRLKVVKGFTAAEARALIEDQIAHDLRRYAATGRLPQSARLEGTKAC